MEKETLIKYCLYVRKSSEQDERQAMSIDSQLKEMQDLARREGLNIVKVLKESHSAKQSGQRPVFNNLVQDIGKGKYNALLTWDSSRISRNAGDIGAIIDLMDEKKLVAIRTFSQTFTNSPNEKFLLMILSSQAKLENDNRGINVKRGIRAKCEMGWRPGNSPIGYINRSFNGVKDIVVDPDRAPDITELFEKAAQGWSGRRIKEWLDKKGFTTKSGKKIALSQVFVILNNTFYYGEFEYPEGSGKIYKGAHKPLIPKELFEQVQNSRALPNKAAWGSKNFAFKDILKCGRCGASITAEEKFKQRVDGGFNRHVYYHCTGKIDAKCPGKKSINEADLVAQLIGFIAENHDKIKVSDELAKKMLIHTDIVEYSLQSRGATEEEIDPLSEYSRYTLTRGSYKEQGKLVQGIEGVFALQDKAIQLRR